MRERPRRPSFPALVLGVMVVVLIIAVALDWQKARAALGRADWRWLPGAVAFTLASYLCSSLSFVIIDRAFDLRLPAPRLLLVSFVTMAVNNLILLGGAAGYGIGGLLLRDRDVPLGDIIAAFAFNSYVYFLSGATFFPASLCYLLLERRLHGTINAALAFLAALGVIVAALINLAVWWRRFRAGLLGLAARLVRAVTRRDVGAALARFNENVTRGLDRLRRRPGRVAALVAFVLLDWSACLTALWFCFAALGTRVAVGTMLPGYFVGISAGSLSMIPGGMGVQEGSMAGVYTLLGVPFETAFLTTILFRMVYYLLPFLLGLVAYWLALRLRDRATPPAPEP